jgi:hypothetical protein
MGTVEFRRDIDPDPLASVLIAIADGLAFSWATTSFDFDWEVLKNQVKKLILDGLRSSGHAKNQRIVNRNRR